MTSLVDVAVEIGNLSELEKQLGQAVAEGSTQQTGTTTVDVSNSDELTGKFKGKSAREIADMYQNLESEYGRKANENGTLRSLADRLLDLKRTSDLEDNSPGKPVKVDVTPTELLDKPTEALERFASARETALESRLNDRLTKIEQATVASQFAAKHPDVQTVAQSSEFQEWVKASPTRQMAANAAAAGNYGAADTLLTEYKANGSRKQPVKEQNDDNLESARKASLESGSSNSQDTGSKKSNQIISRASLMRMRIEKPDQYYDEAYQEVIRKAYAEDRVR